MFNTNEKNVPQVKSIPTNPTNGNGNGNGPSTTVNLIGTGTVIEGEITSDGDIRIDGKVKGTVTSKSKIVLGNTGIIEGDMICENADISGKVFGKVEVEELLYLKASAYLEGDMTTTKFVVETGAKFNGTCRMGIKEIKTNEKISSPQLQKEAV